VADSSVNELAGALARTLRARGIALGPRAFRAPAAAPAADEPPAAAVPAAPEDCWDALRAEALGCTRCPLCETRTTVVFGEGSPTAELMFVGEAPGRDEDQAGRPFVGRAGQLLTRMIEGGMGLARGDVYIANVLKCRPPDNRDPLPEEVAQCRPYLLRQIELVQPKVICTLGRHALHALTDYKGGISRVRGRPMAFLDRVVVPTFHPAYLLRNPAAKREAWEDLKTVLGILGRPVPAVKKPRG